MKKLIASIIKEYLLLVRDRAGLALLFIMPLVFVVVITLIQSDTFNTLRESSIKLILVNDDNDSLGKEIQLGLVKSGMFDVISKFDEKVPNLNKLKEIISRGDIPVGIYIPKASTETIRNNIKKLIENKIRAGKSSKPVLDSVRIKILMDPAIKASFRSAVINSLNNFVSIIEAKIIFRSFTNELNQLLPIPISDEDSYFESNMLVFEEIYPVNSKADTLPNSVQHNIPAWTLFAIFFIVIPFSGNIIKERQDGSGLRLRTMPMPFSIVIGSKLIVYLVVCILQFFLLIAAGVYLMPLFGMPALEMDVNFLALLSVIISSGLAASGYSIAIGTIAKTSEQAAIFGSISVMLLAAMGGIWVPVYIMPEIMKELSAISPMNWALEGMYGIFLRKSSLSSVLLKDLYLLIFFAVTSLCAYAYEKYKRSE